MRCLVVHANPNPDGFGATLFAGAVRALERAGHDVRTIDLYAEGFDPVMSAAEREAYHEAEPILDDRVRRYAADVVWAEAMVFVYPTWWAGLPAILKGWLERVMVPGVAFRHEAVDGGHTVTPNLRGLRTIVGISTYGSGRAFSFVVADAGRRTLLRALWLCARKRTRRVWLGLYGIEGTTPDERAAFVARVEHRLARL